MPRVNIDSYGLPTHMNRNRTHEGNCCDEENIVNILWYHLKDSSLLGLPCVKGFSKLFFICLLIQREFRKHCHFSNCTSRREYRNCLHWLIIFDTRLYIIRGFSQGFAKPEYRCCCVIVFFSCRKMRVNRLTMCEMDSGHTTIFKWK